jgi:hypothetical protein
VASDPRRVGVEGRKTGGNGGDLVGQGGGDAAFDLAADCLDQSLGWM